MLSHLTKRRWLLVLLGLAAIAIVFLGREWKFRSDRGELTAHVTGGHTPGCT